MASCSLASSGGTDEIDSLTNKRRKGEWRMMYRELRPDAEFSIFAEVKSKIGVEFPDEASYGRKE